MDENEITMAEEVMNNAPEVVKEAAKGHSGLGKALGGLMIVGLIAGGVILKMRHDKRKKASAVTCYDNCTVINPEESGDPENDE